MVFSVHSLQGEIAVVRILGMVAEEYLHLAPLPCYDKHAANSHQVDRALEYGYKLKRLLYLDAVGHYHRHSILHEHRIESHERVGDIGNRAIMLSDCFRILPGSLGKRAHGHSLGQLRMLCGSEEGIVDYEEQRR